MNVQLPLGMDKSAFFAWVQGREERYELVDGHVAFVRYRRPRRQGSRVCRLSTLVAYLVLSQDEAKVWVWIRGDSGFTAGSEVIVGGDGVIRIPPLSIELPLAEIYEGVTPEKND